MSNRQEGDGCVGDAGTPGSEERGGYVGDAGTSGSDSEDSWVVLADSYHETDDVNIGEAHLDPSVSGDLDSSVSGDLDRYGSEDLDRSSSEDRLLSSGDTLLTLSADSLTDSANSLIVCDTHPAEEHDQGERTQPESVLEPAPEQESPSNRGAVSEPVSDLSSVPYPDVYSESDGVAVMNQSPDEFDFVLSPAHPTDNTVSPPGGAASLLVSTTSLPGSTEDQFNVASGDDAEPLSSYSRSWNDRRFSDLALTEEGALLVPHAEDAWDRVESPARSLDHSSDSGSFSVQSLPVLLPGVRHYTHHRNTEVNRLLSAMLVLCCVSVLGLGFGHFLGWEHHQEHTDSVVNRMGRKLDSLRSDLLTCLVTEDDADLDNKWIEKLLDENRNLLQRLKSAEQTSSCDSRAERAGEAKSRQIVDQLIHENRNLRSFISKMYRGHGMEDKVSDDWGVSAYSVAVNVSSESLPVDTFAGSVVNDAMSAPGVDGTVGGWDSTGKNDRLIFTKPLALHTNRTAYSAGEVRNRERRRDEINSVVDLVLNSGRVSGKYRADYTDVVAGSPVSTAAPPVSSAGSPVSTAGSPTSTAGRPVSSAAKYRVPLYEYQQESGGADTVNDESTRSHSVNPALIGPTGPDQHNVSGLHCQHTSAAVREEQHVKYHDNTVVSLITSEVTSLPYDGDVFMSAEEVESSARSADEDLFMISDDSDFPASVPTAEWSMLDDDLSIPKDKHQTLVSSLSTSSSIADGTSSNVVERTSPDIAEGTSPGIAGENEKVVGDRQCTGRARLQSEDGEGCGQLREQLVGWGKHLWRHSAPLASAVVSGVWKSVRDWYPERGSYEEELVGRVWEELEECPARVNRCLLEARKLSEQLVLGAAEVAAQWRTVGERWWREYEVWNSDSILSASRDRTHSQPNTDISSNNTSARRLPDNTSQLDQANKGKYSRKQNEQTANSTSGGQDITKKARRETKEREEGKHDRGKRYKKSRDEPDEELKVKTKKWKKDVRKYKKEAMKGNTKKSDSKELRNRDRDDSNKTSKKNGKIKKEEEREKSRDKRKKHKQMKEENDEWESYSKNKLKKNRENGKSKHISKTAEKSTSTQTKTSDSKDEEYAGDGEGDWLLQRARYRELVRSPTDPADRSHRYEDWTTVRARGREHQRQQEGPGEAEVTDGPTVTADGSQGGGRDHDWLKASADDVDVLDSRFQQMNHRGSSGKDRRGFNSERDPRVFSRKDNRKVIDGMEYRPSKEYQGLSDDEINHDFNGRETYWNFDDREGGSDSDGETSDSDFDDEVKDSGEEKSDYLGYFGFDLDKLQAGLDRHMRKTMRRIEQQMRQMEARLL